MKKRNLSNVAASVHDRLLARAKAEGRPFMEVLQYYAIERFLYRLSHAGHADRFVLKGALMGQFFGGGLSRSTRDVDFSGRFPPDPKMAEELIRDCLNAEVEDDGLRFDLESLQTQEIRIDAAYDGLRLTFPAFLERAKIRLQVDIGFGDVITPSPLKLVYPSLLDFEEPRLLGYPPETTLAEKFHAMVVLEMANSRMKDFYDCWLLARNLEIQGESLCSAISKTFERRKTALPGERPLCLSESFSGSSDKQLQWKAFFRKTRIEGEQPPLEHVVQLIEALIMPAITALRSGTSFSKTWKPGGTWT